ncbi:biotin-dependent carboxyltransferase family protein [Bosea sp. 685]|uniref:5-oxoprolinase subunit C family protein n=1 Tax=Bosea sp. 685 TaxID=3080057 RepID=UPI002892D28B|nr:biotin-dependent carboxyltransferase family protein [Bosea sp. 685]WNJ93763.1 biotin-dependent carboxyltransferase family protein [Bosea sp. 685]
MSALIVKACGPATSIQDRGRFGYQRFGVSPAGAMDRFHLAAANLLVAAEPDAAALELGPGGVRVTAEGDITIALAGPACTLEVEGRQIAPFTAVRVTDGGTVVARPAPGAAYAYLGVEGGIAMASDMGSHSMHRRSGIGGGPLAAGARIPAHGGGATLYCLPELPGGETGPIRILPGPQDDHFSDEALAILTGAGYRLSGQADRMGVRLDGPTLPHRGGYNIVSDGIVDGSIQVPGDGRPIVLLRDRQTTGGYPKIATIISADIGRFAQIPPGEPVRFDVVTFEQAIEAAQRLQAMIEGLASALVPLAAPLTSERLLALNLIGGVTSATDARGV